ncbi:quinol dehydrogenase ferredoxin subunit NapH [Quatrionicoccus australiensis]|uniref:quinol dehydrogenase ferredoxin subunit NapH n=1 Tax=Quatrionicoccus australiensis TaxID=138118 RepID=UPI00384C160D|nr:quinol dehydrogenase ferredoxin subunit NapH [Quatrionicoccus australiensis]
METMRPGAEAVRVKGWFGAHRWLILRRISQLTVLALFLSGPWFGVWIAKGNLVSSLTLGVLPLTDPYLFVQSLAAGFMPAATALIGAAIVVAFYALFGGRLYCAWVCPVNAVTDAAAWLRRRLGLKSGRVPDANTRYWVLAGSLLAAAATSSLVWEAVNPVTIVQRSLIFGLGGSLAVVIAIFAYDLLVASRGWCGHLCPMGAFYGLLGQKSLLRITADQRGACDDCMDCFTVCPEPQVIRPALKKAGQDSPLILDRDCTNCGRCIDVCGRNVFHFTHRFDQRSDS